MSPNITRGRGSAKVSRDIFQKKVASFWYFCFSEKTNCHVTHRGGGIEECHQMTKGGMGSKICQKKCHVLFEWPQKRFKTRYTVLIGLDQILPILSLD